MNKGVYIRFIVKVYSEFHGTKCKLPGFNVSFNTIIVEISLGVEVRPRSKRRDIYFFLALPNLTNLTHINDILPNFAC